MTPDPRAAPAPNDGSGAWWSTWYPAMVGFLAGAVAAGASLILLVPMAPRLQRDELIASLREENGRLVGMARQTSGLQREIVEMKRRDQTKRLQAEIGRLMAKVRAQSTLLIALDKDAGALEQTPLPVPEWMPIGDGESSTEAGSSGSIQLVRPVNIAITDASPTFEFRPASGATLYRVHVESTGGETAVRAVSPTMWKPVAPLRPGIVYRWSVTAEHGGAAIHTRSAMVYVLTAAQRQDIATSRQRYAQNPLALGLLYARFGLLSDTERELKTALHADPRQQAARRWLNELEQRAAGTAGK